MIQCIIDDIRPCGLSPTKSEAFHPLSEILVEEHQGQVPEDYKALEALSGVGYKTASVVISQAYWSRCFSRRSSSSPFGK